MSSTVVIPEEQWTNLKRAYTEHKQAYYTNEVLKQHVLTRVGELIAHTEELGNSDEGYAITEACARVQEAIKAIADVSAGIREYALGAGFSPTVAEVMATEAYKMLMSKM